MDGTAQEAGVPTRGTPTTTCGGSPEGHSLFYYVRGESRGAPLLLLRAGGVQRGTPTTSTCGGSPEGHPYYFYVRGESRGGTPTTSTCGGSPERHPYLLLRAGGVQRGTPTYYYVRGESRGAPLLLLRAGGVQRGHPYYFYVRGESRGGTPTTSTCGGSPEGHPYLLLRAGGVQRGTASLAGVWGCPPEIFYFFPLPSRKGARGMVRATIETTETTRSEAEVPHATPPQIATSQPPRNDGGGHGGDLTSVMACPTLASTKAVKGFIRLQDLAEKRLQMCSEPCQIRRTPDGLCSSNQRSAPALAF